MNRTRFGIIGGGVVAPFHAEAVSQLDDAELMAVATTREKTAKSFAKKFGAEVWYTDYHKLLKRKDIDVVSICTPHFLHEEMTIAAAKEGKHVLVEKPIAINLRQADRMIETCEKAGVKLGLILQSRFNKNVRRIKEAVDKGNFGKLIMGSAYVKWFRTQEYYDSIAWRGTWDKEGGGVLINQAIHTIDLLQWFMGEVDSLYAFIDTAVHNIEVEDVAVAALRFKNGSLGVIEATTAAFTELVKRDKGMYPGLPRKVEIQGEKGTVILEGDEIKLWEFVHQREDVEEERAGKYQGKELGDVPSDQAENHKLQIKDFIEAVRENREPLVNGLQGRNSLQIVRAIYRSARTKKPVKFPVRD